MRLASIGARMAVQQGRSLVVVGVSGLLNTNVNLSRGRTVPWADEENQKRDSSARICLVNSSEEVRIFQHNFLEHVFALPRHHPIPSILDCTSRSVAKSYQSSGIEQNIGINRGDARTRSLPSRQNSRSGKVQVNVGYWVSSHSNKNQTFGGDHSLHFFPFTSNDFVCRENREILFPRPRILCYSRTKIVLVTGKSHQHQNRSGSHINKQLSPF